MSAENGLCICVIAGMIDAKLRSKLAPLQHNERIRVIHLIRRQDFTGDKIVCHAPPRVLRGVLPLAELWRVVALGVVALIRRPRALVALGVVPHGLYAWLVGKLLRVPVIQHVQGPGDLRAASPGQRGRGIALAAVGGAARVAVRGRNMERWLVDRGLPPERIFVPQNLHDFDVFSPGTSKPDFDLVYAGTFYRVKRLDVLLAALARARQQRPGTNLLMVGDGPERPALVRLADELQLSSVVEFAGEQPHDQLPRWMGRARALIMTSEGEGLPMAVVEAMSMGLPVIVPSVGELEELAVHEQNALVVPPLDADGFARAIIRLLDDEKLYARLSRGALALRRTHRREYSLTHQVEVWAAALDAVGPH